MWTDGRRTDHGYTIYYKLTNLRTTDDRPWLYYKLTNEPKGSGELKKMNFSFYTEYSNNGCLKVKYCFKGILDVHSIQLYQQKLSLELFQVSKVTTDA